MPKVAVTSTFTVHLPQAGITVDLSSIRLEGTVPAVVWPHEKKKRRHEHGCGHDHERHE